MNCRDMADIALKTAAILDPSIHLGSQKYPKDLGSWGIDEPKLDELRRHFKLLTVEMKVYDINDEEFPTFKGKNLLEIELRSDMKSARKVFDILKRIKAFSIEKYHVTNLKRKLKQEEEFLDSKDEYEGLLPFEYLNKKMPEIFKNDDLLQLTSEQVNKLSELSFLDDNSFILNKGKYLLWIDWIVDDNKMKQIVDVLCKDIKQEEEFLDNNDTVNISVANNVVHDVFKMNLGEFKKYFSDIKGKITYKDETTESSEISGKVKKQWLNEYFSGYSNKEIEKILEQRSSSGPGQAYSNIYVTLKDDKDEVDFTIILKSGLDV